MRSSQVEEEVTVIVRSPFRSTVTLGGEQRVEPRSVKKAAVFSANCRARGEHRLPHQQLPVGFVSLLRPSPINTYFGECGQAAREQRNSQMVLKMASLR